MVYEQVGHKGGPVAKKYWSMNKWDIRGDPLLKIMVYEQVGHKGGPFAKKTWCTNKWDIKREAIKTIFTT